MILVCEIFYPELKIASVVRFLSIRLPFTRIRETMERIDERLSPTRDHRSYSLRFLGWLRFWTFCHVESPGYLTALYDKKMPCLMPGRFYLVHV